MTTIINYSRSFLPSTVHKGDQVTVTFRISFISPPGPSLNLWFDNLGDNLGGSTATTSPLSHAYNNYVTTTNLTPYSVQQANVGVGSNDGCLRVWTGGGTYPSSTSLATVWKPINPNTYTELEISAQYSATSSAIIGTVISQPTRAIPTSNTNYDAGKMMIDLGSDFILNISNQKPGTSSTLTILSGHH